MFLRHFISPFLVMMIFSATTLAKDIPLEKCPLPVQETIRHHARDGVIDEVEYLAIEGRRMFIAEIEFPQDRELKIYVQANGTLFKTREEIALQDTPTAVQEAAQRLADTQGKVDDVVKTIEASGKESYELEFKLRGKKEVKIVFSPDGSILSRKEKKSKD
jgi:hypothetical protein